MPEKIKKKVLFKVFCTGFDIFQIGIIIDEKKEETGENLCLLETEFPSREEALIALKALKRRKS